MTLLLAAVLTAEVAASAMPAVAEWQWESDPNICILFQTADERQEQLSIQVYPASNTTWLIVANLKATVAKPQPLTDVHVSFEPSGATIASGRVELSDKKRNVPIVTLKIDDPAFFSNLARATALRVSHSALGEWRQPLRATAPAVDALRACEDSRLRNWGIDPVAWHAMRSPPMPLTPLPQLFTPDDYPPGYALNGVTGQVVARLTVGTSGAVEKCVAINPRVDVYFAEKICGILKRRARFRPATDNQGQPIVGIYVTSAIFQME